MTESDFDAFHHASAFPKAPLHPSIADAAWLAFIRGDLPTAVFSAFKAAEEAARSAAKFSLIGISVPLMRKVFGRIFGSH